MSQAGLANMITWKNFSLVSQDPSTAIVGARLTRLAWLSCNRKADLMALTNVPTSRQTDTSPANQASPAHVIRPLASSWPFISQIAA